MINNHLHQKRFSLLVAFLTAFCLLFAGMRVPDISRPHRPKPSQRAVIESPVKASQQHVNKSTDILAIPATPAESPTAFVYRTEFVSVLHSIQFPPLFPNSSRAPPQFLS
jgi:hypothetical protein